MTSRIMIPAPYTLVAHDSVTSTQIEARMLADEGAAGWTLVTARDQTSGRGRFDRAWASSEGNLYATLVLRPGLGQPPADTALALVNLATGLALVEGLSRLASGVNLVLKWPNDILVGGAKLAGILTEALLEPGAAPTLLIGFGVNLNHHPDDLPYPATSFAIASGGTGRIEPSQALGAILPVLHDRLSTFLTQGFEPLRPAYLSRLAQRGEKVRVYLDAAKTQKLDGVLLGIGPDGGLELETPTGVRRIQAGDVMPIRETQVPRAG